MNISRPPLPISSQTRQNNLISPPAQDQKSRQKSRKASKHGVTLARDHSIRFDKQYQQKHMVSKSGIRLNSPKKYLNAKQLQQTTINDRSTFISNSKTFNMLDETVHRPVSNTTYVAFSAVGLNDDSKSMTSLDLNHPKQLEKKYQK